MSSSSTAAVRATQQSSAPPTPSTLSLAELYIDKCKHGGCARAIALHATWFKAVFVVAIAEQVVTFTKLTMPQALEFVEAGKEGERWSGLRRNDESYKFRTQASVTTSWLLVRSTSTTNSQRNLVSVAHDVRADATLLAGDVAKEWAAKVMLAFWLLAPTDDRRWKLTTW
jgi:hypothetical protein